MSAAKSGEVKVDAGCNFIDYWPTYGDGHQGVGMRPGRFREVIGAARKSIPGPSLISCVSDVRSVLLLVLRSVRAPLPDEIQSAHALPWVASNFAPSD